MSDLVRKSEAPIPFTRDQVASFTNAHIERIMLDPYVLEAVLTYREMDDPVARMIHDRIKQRYRAGAPIVNTFTGEVFKLSAETVEKRRARAQADIAKAVRAREEAEEADRQAEREEADQLAKEEYDALVSEVATAVKASLPAPAPVVKSEPAPDRGPAVKHVCRDKNTGLIMYTITEWPESADPKNMLMMRPIRDEHGDIKSLVEEYFEANELVAPPSA